MDPKAQQDFNVQKEEKEESAILTPAHIVAEDDFKGKLVDPQSERRLTKTEILLVLVYSACFIIVSFLLFDPDINGKVNDHLRFHYDSYDVPFHKIKTGPQFLDWFTEFLTHVQTTEYYPSRQYERIGNPTVGGPNNLITLIRLTQRRMKIVDDVSHDFSNYNTRVWANDGFNPYSQDLQDGEDTTPYGPNDTYRYYYTEGMSGFRIFFDCINKTLKESLSKVKELKDTGYIDKQTRAVYAIYSLYNPQSEVYSLVFHYIIFSKTGSTSPDLQIYNFHKRYYRGSGSELFRAICEGIYVILLGLYAVQHVFSIIVTYTRVQVEDSDRQFAQDQWNKRHGKGVPPSSNLMMGFCKKIKDKLLFGIKLLYTHLSNMWNLLDLVSIILGIVSVILWIRFIADYGSWSLTTEMIGQAWAPINTFFLGLANLFYTMKMLAAFNLLIVFTRVLKYLGEIIARVAVLFNSLDKAKSDILHYIFLLMSVMLAFIFFVYIYFGSVNEDYSTMDRVMRSLFQFMNWWYQCFNALLTKDFWIGLLLFIAFMISVVFVLLNMFTGFLIRAFKEADTELKLQVDGRDLKTRKKHLFFIEKHPFVQLSEFVLKILALFLKKYKIKKEEAAREEQQYYTALNITKDESKDFDIEYNPLASFVDEKSKLPLTSFYVEEKYNIERDKRCGRILYSGLIFLGFTILYLCILYFQIRVDYGSIIVSSMRRRFVEDVYFQKPNTSTRLTIEDVNDWPSLTDWLRLVPLATATDFSPDANSYNYMLGAEVKLSFRLGKTLPWGSQLDQPYERMPTESDVGFEQQTTERTEQIVGKYSGTTYNFTSTKAYLGTSGYILHWNMTPARLATISSNFVNDGLVGPDMWYLALEAVMYQPVLAACVYSSILFKFLKSGQFVKEYFAFPIPMGYYTSTRSILRGVFELILLAFVIFYIINFCCEVVYKWREYDKWIDAQMPYFTQLQKYQRKMKTPEFIRKAIYLFTLYRILDVLFFILFIVSIGYYIEVLARSKDMERSMPYDHTALDYHNIIRKAVTAFLNYINYSSFAFLMLALRLMEYMQFMGNMQVLTAALGRAQSDIFYYVVIFSSFMMAFAGMAYIAFGEGCPDFRTLGIAWRSCFFMLLGEFDISDMLTENSALTTLFLFVFLIFFSYVLLNIFLAILEINFAESRDDYNRKVVTIRKWNAVKCCFLPDLSVPKGEKRGVSTAKHVREFIESLDKFRINLKSKSDSIMWWADDIARDIHSEYLRRQQLAEEVCKAIFSVPSNVVRIPIDPTTTIAAFKRGYMLHYLRTASQFIEFQNRSITQKCFHLDAQIESNTAEFNNGRQIHFFTNHICRSLEVQRRSCSPSQIRTAAPLIERNIEEEQANLDDLNSLSSRPLANCSPHQRENRETLDKKTTPS